MTGRILAVLLSVGVLPVATAPASAAPDQDCSVAAAKDVQAAIQIAGRCHKSIEALSARSETTQVFVDPSGVGKLISAIEPQRVRRTDGSWADIDTTLRADGGQFVPVASTADVRISGGGSGPLVTWREGTSTFELSWPGVLPVPRIDGDTAVFDEVLPGVNLHVSADRAGFRHVLEVLTPQAAANPALQQIRYDMGGDMRVARAADGGLSLTDTSGKVVGQASPALMWNSDAGLPAVQAMSMAAEAGGDEAPAGAISGAQGPGDLAETAPVAVALSGDDLVLDPDDEMLAAPAESFPVFIDPAFSKAQTKWGYSTNNGETNDTSWARVGLNEATGALYRSYFSFDTSAMRNTTVLTASIEMKLGHSWSCTPTWVHLYRTNGTWEVGSGGRLGWTNEPLGSAATWLDSWEGNAHDGGSCPQPDADAIFDRAELLSDLKAKVMVSSSYWVGLCACNPTDEYETAQDRWKRFYTDKSFLIATYDLKPVAPVGLAFTTTSDCYAQCTSPALVRSLNPTLRSQVQDPYGGQLTTYYEIRTAADLAAPIVVDTATMPTSVQTTVGNAIGTATSQVPPGKLAAGNTYYWHATTKDEAGLWSGWGPWYSFTIDKTPPVISGVSSSQYPLKAWGVPVGTAGTFTITATGADEYTWDVDGGTATTTTSASVSYTAATSHVHVLHVKAKDKAGNPAAATFDYEFWVSPTANAYSHWTFDETAPATTAADSGSGFSTKWPGTLAGEAEFVPGYLGNAVHLTGPSDRVTTAGPVLDTTKSFTVMAWVRASDLAAQSQQTIMAQDGTTASRFELQYRQDANGGTGGWCFTMSGDSGGGGTISACATGQAAGLPANDTWVHVAGRYDQVSGKIRVYVMGDTQSCAGEVTEATAPAPWSALSSLAIGRGWSGGAGVSYWRGDIDDARAYQRVLSDSEICQQASQ